MISDLVREQIEKVSKQYPKRESALMCALDIVQRDSGGHIAGEDLAEIGDIMDVSTARVHGVYTYYTMYNKKPVGK